MSVQQTTLSESVETQLKGDCSLDELSAAADRCDSITEVSQDLRVPYHRIKHDLGVIGRLDELAKGRSLAKQLRAQANETDDDQEDFSKYKRGGA